MSEPQYGPDDLWAAEQAHHAHETAVDALLLLAKTGDPETVRRVFRGVSLNVCAAPLRLAHRCVHVRRQLFRV